MDRELSSCRTAPFQLVSVIDINIMHSKKRECLEIHSQFSSMKFVPVSSRPSHAWKDVSEKVQANHSISNIRVRAIPALIPMKDKLHRMLHRKGGKKDSARDPEQDSAEERCSIPEAPAESPFMSRGTAPLAELSENEVFEASQIQLMGWVVSERYASIQLQKISLECSSECLAKLSQFVANSLSLLIVHKFGNYLVQNCITRDAPLRTYVKSFCEKNFGRLIKDQYGSRVLQVLVQLSNSFRRKLMEVFRTELGVYLKSISAVFLMNSALCLCKDESERDIVTAYLSSNRKRWLHVKYFKKILITYIENCSEERLEAVFHLTRMTRSIGAYLLDKYMTIVIFKLIERNHSPTKQVVLEQVKYKPIWCISLKNFSYMIELIIRRDATAEFGAEIQRLLTHMPRTDHLQLMKDLSLFQVYSGVLSTLSVKNKFLSDN